MSISGVLLSLLIVAALALPFSIGDVRASTAEIGKPFNLGIGQSTQVAGIDVTFANVTEDSRCPSDVNCIWAGQVSAAVNVKYSGGEDQLVLTLSAGQSEPKPIGSYSIRLVDIQPYPVSAKKISPSDYMATLVISSGVQAMSHGVFVKGYAPGVAVVAGWNVEKGSGALVLLVHDNGLKRSIIKFVPTTSNNCAHGQDPAECIDGSAVGQAGSIHAEIDGSRMHLFVTPSEGGKEYALNITTFKTYEKPVVTGGNSSVVYLNEGQRDGPLLVQKIYPDRIEGLNFPEYPIATDRGLPITLHVGDKATNGCTVTLTLVKIEGGTAMFSKTVDNHKPCPICWLQAALTGGQ